ncbi:MAG: hypothetical protein GXY06_04340 [Clostridiaceae bacterium]|nr:hypothetical protein [Clostridiaceae bacterium]
MSDQLSSLYSAEGDRAFSEMPLWQEEKVALHMPGHVSNNFFSDDDCKYLIGIDTTELSLSDNLHDPKSTVLEIQQWIQSLYGSGLSRILTTGSTTGIQVMLSASLSERSHLLLDRRCHMSAAYAVSLIGCRYSFIQDIHFSNETKSTQIRPEDIPICDDTVIERDVLDLPKQIEKCLDYYKDISDVLITSPDYFGRCEPIRQIAEVVHRFGCRLLVDEAHGAHFVFGDSEFPEPAIRCGADMVVQSAHKTLPALTMASLLHVSEEAIKTDRVNPRRLNTMLRIYETSSPSFIIAASLQMALKRMDYHGREQFALSAKRIRDFRDRLATLPGVDIMPDTQGKLGDPMRVCVSFSKAGINASEVALELERKGFVVEMHSPIYLLMLFNIFRTEEELNRLFSEIKGIVLRFQEAENLNPDDFSRAEDIISSFYARPLERAMHIREAVFSDIKTKTCVLEDSVGRVSAAMILLYPPGIPFIWPGEILSKKTVGQMLFLIDRGFAFDGIEDNCIQVLDNTKSNA